MNVPAGTDYRVSVSYRATIGAGAWTLYGYSAAPGFAVTSSVTSISVTAPSAGSTYTRPFNLPVVFRPNVANTAGEFGLWIRNSAGTSWYFIKTVTPTGAAQYNDIIPLTSAIPAGTGYRVSVSWRVTPGLGAWTVYGYSAAPGFTIN